MGCVVVWSGRVVGFGSDGGGKHCLLFFVFFGRMLCEWREGVCLTAAWYAYSWVGPALSDHGRVLGLADI